MLEVLLLPLLAIAIVQLIRFLLGSSQGEKELSEKGIVLRGRLRLIGVLTLAAGLLAAVFVSRNARLAPETDKGALGYEIGAGYAYPIMPGMTKHDEAQMEQIGGKAGVAIADFEDWCGTLWHGKRLASTLAVLSVGGCLTCLFLARLLPE